MRTISRILCHALTLSPLLLAPSAAGAAPLPPSLTAYPGSDDAVRAYWTPERIANAKSADIVPSGPVHRGHAATVVKGARQIVHGAFPTEEYDFSLATKLFDESLLPRAPGARAPLLGSGNLPYTTNRLYPQNDKVLYKVYPYATVGHLFFTEPSGNFQCTASVIRLSTIATAGHCVSDGAGHYYTNWMFIPAQNGTQAPFGTWTWANAITTSAWFTGGGGVPNEQDDAIIILNQKKYKKVLHKIGDLTGYLGYEFNTPLPTAISQLGYPCNLDSCSDPVATYSQETAGPTNNFQWGTASFGGASGGPEIQDFGQAPSGVPAETLGGNIVVSSTSYTYSSTTEVDGASIFYAPGQNSEYTFGDDINFACANGGC
jgi:hypothetical protein